MSAHTPGPWINEKRDGGEWWFGGNNGAEIVIRPQSAKPFCNFAVIGASWSSDEGEADARLIAAAPELYEALESTLNWLSSYPGQGTMGINGPYEQARAALAKARGES